MRWRHSLKSRRTSLRGGWGRYNCNGVPCRGFDDLANAAQPFTADFFDGFISPFSEILIAPSFAFRTVPEVNCPLGKCSLLFPVAGIVGAWPDKWDRHIGRRNYESRYFAAFAFDFHHLDALKLMAGVTLKLISDPRQIKIKDRTHIKPRI